MQFQKRTYIFPASSPGGSKAPSSSFPSAIFVSLTVRGRTGIFAGSGSNTCSAFRRRTFRAWFVGLFAEVHRIVEFERLVFQSRRSGFAIDACLENRLSCPSHILSNLALLTAVEESLVLLKSDVLPRVFVCSARGAFLHFLARGRRGCVFLVLRRTEVGLVVLLWWLWEVLRLRVVVILRLRGGGSTW